MYGLPLTDIKFQFDGETIKDSETPHSLDMEDENMVDVTVSRGLIICSFRESALDQIFWEVLCL